MTGLRSALVATSLDKYKFLKIFLKKFEPLVEPTNLQMMRNKQMLKWLLENSLLAGESRSHKNAFYATIRQ